jgi:hypothetical protein
MAILFDMLPHLPRQRFLDKSKLIRLLQVHPEFGSGVEKGSQANHSIPRDPALPFDHRGDPICWDVEGLASMLAFIGGLAGFMNSSKSTLLGALGAYHS